MTNSGLSSEGKVVRTRLLNPGNLLILKILVQTDKHWLVLYFSTETEFHASRRELLPASYIMTHEKGEPMTANEAKQRFTGCYVATLTPFSSDDTVDSGVAREHASWLVENGVEGLCPAGTTGEFLFLAESEKRALITAAVEGAKGRVPILAGVWAMRSEAVCDLARHAEATGAQGVFLPTPIYYPADDAQIYQWYAQVHKATSLPVFAYNIPQYAANTISIGCLQRLFADGIIAGVKDSMGKTERMTELVHHFSAAGVVFAASDGFATEGRKIGADGFISAIGNAVPHLFAQLWAGNEGLQAQVNELRTALKQMGSIPALKYLCKRQGFDMGNARLPFSGLTAEQRGLLDQVTLEAAP